MTITTRYEHGSYIATIDGKDVSKSPSSGYQAAKHAAGPENHVKEINPNVFRVVPKNPAKTP